MADGRWAEIDELHPGLEIVTQNGDRAVVITVVETNRREQTYNFEVEGFHTYFIGEAGIWVHNACRVTAAFQRQYALYGRSSLEKSYRTISANLSTHLDNAKLYQSQGGYTSSVIREIRTFDRQLQALDRLLSQLP